MDLVMTVFGGEGDMLALTRRGQDVLAVLRGSLSAAGELKWRSDNQRWVIFGETDYDKVFDRIFPDNYRKTAEYLGHLGLRSGMRVLEIGAGTGRVTVDLGLCDLVGREGSVTALDPTVALLQKLAAKCRDRGLKNVEIVQGIVENLPFPDNSFDAAIAVESLHFTYAPKAVSEMVRVTNPGGLVSALCPPPEFDLRNIPMVALWFRPLTSLAEHFGVPFTEHNGLRVGLLKETFQNHLHEVELWDVPFLFSAEDYHSFLAFVIKGAAVFQNIFCHLPYQERWNIIRRLEEDGARIAAETSREEKSCLAVNEAACGRVPAKPRNPF